MRLRPALLALALLVPALARGAGGATLYFRGTQTNGISGYDAKYARGAASGTATAASCVASDALFRTYYSDAASGAATLNGNITGTFWGDTSNAACNNGVKIVVSRRTSGGSESVLCTASGFAETPATPGASDLGTCTLSNVSISTGDRIKIDVYRSPAGGSGGTTRTHQLWWDGPTAAAEGDSYIALPVCAVGITDSDCTVAVTGVSVTPTTASVSGGATATFAATIAPSNATNKTVNWSVTEGATCGTVRPSSTTGDGSTTTTFTAATQSSYPATCHLVATSDADGTKTGSATITVEDPNAIRIATSGSAASPGATSVDVPNLVVPAGPNVVLIASCYQSGGVNTASITSSPALTWTRKGQTTTFVTFAAPYTGAGETFSYVRCTDATSNRKHLGVVVVANADTSELGSYNAAALLGQNTFTTTQTLAGTSSLLIANVQNWQNDTITPDTGTTQIFHQANSGLGYSLLALRNTTPGTGSTTVSGTWGSTGDDYQYTWIEVRQAASSNGAAATLTAAAGAGALGTLTATGSAAVSVTAATATGARSPIYAEARVVGAPVIEPGFPVSAVRVTSGSGLASPSFTPPAGALLVAIGWDPNNHTIGMSDSTGLTWTERISSTSYPKVSIWTATAPASPVSMTVTATPSASTATMGVAVYAIPNGSPIGATGQTSQTLTSAPYAVSVTPQASDSLVVAGFSASQNSAIGLIQGDPATTVLDGAYSSSTDTGQFGFGHSANPLESGVAYSLGWTLVSGNGIRDTAAALEVRFAAVGAAATLDAAMAQGALGTLTAVGGAAVSLTAAAATGVTNPVTVGSQLVVTLTAATATGAASGVGGGPDYANPHPPQVAAMVQGTQPAVSEPALGASISNVFPSGGGTTTSKRVADVGHRYPKQQPWSADELRAQTYYNANSARPFYDVANNYSSPGTMKDLAVAAGTPYPNEYWTWSNKLTTANIIYGVRNSTTGTGCTGAGNCWIKVDADNAANNATLKQYVASDFGLGSLANISYGGDEGNMDDEDTGAVLLAASSGTTYVAAALITPSTGAVRCVPSGGYYGSGHEITDGQMSHDGRHVLLDYAGHGIESYSATDCSFERQLNSAELHWDACVSTAGDQVIVFSSDDATYHDIEMVRIVDGGRTRIYRDTGSWMPQHVSCRSKGRPGWATISLYYSSATGTDAATLNAYHRVFAVKLDGTGTLENWAWDHQANPAGTTDAAVLEAHPAAVASPSGRWVWMKSGWDVTNGTVRSYVVYPSDSLATLTAATATGGSATLTATAGTSATLSAAAATGATTGVTAKGSAAASLAAAAGTGQATGPTAKGGAAVSLAAAAGTGGTATLTATGAAAVSLAAAVAQGALGTLTAVGHAAVSLVAAAAQGATAATTATGSGAATTSVTLTAAGATGIAGTLTATGGAASSLAAATAQGLLGTLSAKGGAAASLTAATALGGTAALTATSGLSVSLVAAAGTGATGTLSAKGASSVSLSAAAALGATAPLTVVGHAAVTLAAAVATGATNSLSAALATGATLTSATATGAAGTLSAAGGAAVQLIAAGATAVVGALEVAAGAAITLDPAAAVGAIGEVTARGLGPIDMWPAPVLRLVIERPDVALKILRPELDLQVVRPVLRLKMAR